MSEVSDEVPAADEPTVPETPPAPESQPTVGATLRRERERQGLTLVDVARHLKLAPRQIDALENDDAKALPGPVFVRGFTRSYARLLGLDGDALIKTLDPLPGTGDAAVAEPAQPVTIGSPVSLPSGRRRDRKSGRRSWWPVTVALILVAVVIVYWRGRQPEVPQTPAEMTLPSASAPTVEAPTVAQPATDPGATPPTTPAPDASITAASSPVVQGAAPGPAAPAAPAPAPVVPVASAPPVESPAPAVPPAPVATAPAAGSGSGELHFNFARDAWVEVKDATGSIVFSQLSPAGSERVVRGQAPFQLVVGNAAGVRVTYNTRPVDLAPHTRTDVARVTLE